MRARERERERKRERERESEFSVGEARQTELCRDLPVYKGR